MTWLGAVPAWCWWLIALVLVAGGQQYRVVVAQGETASARGDLADYRPEVSRKPGAIHSTDHGRAYTGSGGMIRPGDTGLLKMELE